jgi:hypothetical protein
MLVTMCRKKASSIELVLSVDGAGRVGTIPGPAGVAMSRAREALIMMFCEPNRGGRGKRRARTCADTSGPICWTIRLIGGWRAVQDYRTVTGVQIW